MSNLDECHREPSASHHLKIFSQQSFVIGSGVALFYLQVMYNVIDIISFNPDVPSLILKVITKVTVPWRHSIHDE